MIISLLLAAIFLLLAVIFLIGKGDMLIAGYNTADEEERNKVNIKRLRLLMAILSVLSSAFCGFLPFIDKKGVSSFGIYFILVVIVFIILANTWAKKK
ncbi:MAG: DUF3784 domain-containing protein [Bacteroidaceae bacterium]|nr:DUF3784 domain-containing protein [Bacteroidaceae bacterium]